MVRIIAARVAIGHAIDRLVRVAAANPGPGLDPRPESRGPFLPKKQAPELTAGVFDRFRIPRGPKTPDHGQTALVMRKPVLLLCLNSQRHELHPRALIVPIGRPPRSRLTFGFARA